MRYNVEIKPEAIFELDKVRRDNIAAAKKFTNLVDRLTEVGLALPQIKKVSDAKNCWRLRFGRYRALLTLDESKFTIWIVFLKKDPHKEYDKWLEYLRRHADI